VTWRERHIQLVEAVNAAKTAEEHRLVDARREGFLEAIRAVFGEVASGEALMDADWHYMGLGIDRPMCGGVFLDWSPEVRP
jgi:hypothetical protein